MLCFLTGKIKMPLQISLQLLLDQNIIWPKHKKQSSGLTLGPLSSGMSVVTWNNVEGNVEQVKNAVYETLPGAKLVKMQQYSQLLYEVIAKGQG